jgi:hypothetical protein
VATIKLGSKYRDKYTGYTGTAMCRTEWINGCARVSLQQLGVDKDGKPFALETFDDMQLELVEEVKTARDNKTGGPRPSVEKRR